MDNQRDVFPSGYRNCPLKWGCVCLPLLFTRGTWQESGLLLSINEWAQNRTGEPGQCPCSEAPASSRGQAGAPPNTGWCPGPSPGHFWGQAPPLAEAGAGGSALGPWEEGRVEGGRSRPVGPAVTPCAAEPRRDLESFIHSFTVVYQPTSRLGPSQVLANPRSKRLNSRPEMQTSQHLYPLTRSQKPHACFPNVRGLEPATQLSLRRMEPVGPLRRRGSQPGGSGDPWSPRGVGRVWVRSRRGASGGGAASGLARPRK